MAHFILEEACTGCMICAKKCPVNAIEGEKKGLHVINPDTCIDCEVCGWYCPFDAIENQHDVVATKRKPVEIPKAVVFEELCTGCDYCISICPENALVLEETDTITAPIAKVIEKKCVGCNLCAEICIKGAVKIWDAVKGEWVESAKLLNVG